MADEWKVRLIGIEPREKERPSDPNMVIVSYGLKRVNALTPEWVISTAVSTDHIKDDDLIRVAKSHLAYGFADLANNTAEWQLPKEWFEASVKPKADQNK